MGSSAAGIVEEIGPLVKHHKLGDEVFGYVFRSPIEKSHQEYVTTQENQLGKIPRGFSMQQAVVLCNNFVSTWHTLTRDLNFELPWPKPHDYEPKEKNEWILVWGGGSSVGQYALQVLKYYGYQNIITTASKPHHEKLIKYGAASCFDYKDGNVVENILHFVQGKQGTTLIPHIVDCISSQSGSLSAISKLAQNGSRVAAMLPVVIKDAAEGVKPEYSMQPENAVQWADGVTVIGVRTHFYLENSFLAQHLQTTIMPAALDMGFVEPNEQIIVEGDTLLERAEKALSMLRRKEVSRGRLIWRVSDK